MNGHTIKPRSNRDILLSLYNLMIYIIRSDRKSGLSLVNKLFITEITTASLILVIHEICVKFQYTEILLNG